MLTKRQKRVYDWVRNFLEQEGYVPSYEEIKSGLGFRSLNTVHYHLQRLEAGGYLHSPWGNKKRAFELAERGTGLRLLGEVVAGEPVESYEVPGEVALPSGLFNRKDHFALKVRGDSMIGEGILDGDTIVVRKSDRAKNGEVVVALVDGDATVKKFGRKGVHIELIPANPDYQTIVARAEQVQVLGIVVALFRSY